MPRVSPFVGLRFEGARVGSFESVTAPPYDVISPEEHARFLAASPYNVIRLDLVQPAGASDVGDGYADAARTLSAWRGEGVLASPDGLAYYPYEMRFPLGGRDRRVRGLICAVELEDWGGGIVPHERTMRGPVEDRLRLMRAIATNASCIYAVFAGPLESVATWLDDATAGDPVAAFTDDDRVEHRLWVASPDRDVAGWLGPSSFMIADGHHRYATALRYRDEMRAQHGAGPWDRVMMFVVDASIEDPPVLPFHRIVLEGAEPSAGARVRDLQEVLASVDDRKCAYGTVAHEHGRLVHRVADLPGKPPTVSRLHERVLAGLDEAVRYTPDAVAAENAVRRDTAAAAYLLPPTDAATIKGVVDAGETLPQKSTFFWPKPRTGTVMRALDTD